MSRVMLIGYGPLPQVGVGKIVAAALRTRQILKPIVEAGHSVYLFTLPLPGTEGAGAEVGAMTPDNYEGLTYQKFTNHDGAFALRSLTEQVKQLHPDAIIGVGTYCAYLAASLPYAIPVWADLGAYWMAEAQGRAHVTETDEGLADAWTIERAIVRRVDRYSAVSRPQLYAVLGEMASVGRLNWHTYKYQFGSYIPNSAYRWKEAAPATGERDAPTLRGPIVPTDAFIILWSGGFSAACDLPTLVGAMNALMERYPSVHLVTTGGRLEGQELRVYQDYEELVEASAYKDRFHNLGWVSSEKLPKIYHEADMGINVDSSNYETLFGGRARLNAMAAEGLALASTIGTEISEWLDEGHALLGAPMGDAAALVEAIEPWIDQPEHLRELGEKARRIMDQDFTNARTTRALVAWLARPALAPDNQARLASTEGRGTDLAQVAINTLDEDALQLSNHPMRDLKDAHEQVQNLRKGKLRGWLLGVK